ncbi:MAG: TonB-dependent receptor [Saprospiraceae bacterium]|nr:TonB-dependent receptor [Saprospiraceae bacterium]
MKTTSLVIILLSYYSYVYSQNEIDSIPLSITYDEEIVVTGQYAPTDVEKSLLPIIIITKEMIEKRSATSITEVLQQEVAIRTQRDGVLGNSILMNGLSAKHINIMINGVPMIGRSNGNLDLDRIQIQNIERIEIIENAMSVDYGTNALGGTINIITQKNILDSWDAHIMSQIQSNEQYNISAGIGKNWKGINISANYNYSYFNGFSMDTLRTQEWNPKTQHNFIGNINYSIPKTSIKLAYNFNLLNESIDDKGIIKLENFPTLSYAKDYAYITNTQDHSLSMLGYLNNKKSYFFDGIISFNDYNRKKIGYFRSLYQNPSEDTIDNLDSDTTSFQAWNTRLTLASNYNKKIDYKAGINIRYDYTAGARINENNASITIFGVFASFRYRPITALTINGGIRVEYNTLAKFPITYSAAIKWKPISFMQLHLNYARGIRTPSLKELYLDFVDINHHIKGNPNLKPEYAHNIRLSWKLNKAIKDNHILNLSINAFYNYIEQQITLFNYETDSLGNYIMDLNSNKYAYFNLDEYQNWGLANNLKYQYNGLTIQLGVNVIGHYNRLSRDYTNTIPLFNYTLEISQEISYQFKKIGLTISLFRRDYDKQISYSLSYDPISQEDVIVQNNLDGYGLMDLNVSKSFWNKGLVLSAGIKNIMNVVQVNRTGLNGAHSSGNTVSVGMGRIYFIKLLFQPFAIKNKNQKSLSEF